MSKNDRTTPLAFRFVEFVLDDIIAHARVALWPVHAAARVIRGLVAMLQMLSNEYQKRLFGSCGRGVRLHGNFVLTSAGNFHVGDNVHINKNAFFRAEGGLTIASNVHISRNTVIYTMNHNYEGKVLPYDASKLLKPVTIGKNVWIGMNVTITPGVSVGDGAILGMGAVISRDVAANDIVGANPQRVLKARNAQHYQSLESRACYGGMSGYPLRKK